jgi:hypothetical protein
MKRLARSEGLSITARRAGRLADQSRIKDQLLLWTYVFELGRRARGESKGPPIHRIWRAMAPATRRNLTTELVWEARSSLSAVLSATEQ